MENEKKKDFHTNMDIFPHPVSTVVPHAIPEDTTLPLEGTFTTDSKDTCTAFSGTLPRDFPPEPCSRTASCIVLSAFYAKLLVVITTAFLTSEIMTNNIKLYFFEAFFTYLYGASILFLLYIFCYLLQECNRRKVKRGKKDSSKKKQFSLLKKWSKSDNEEQKLTDSDLRTPTKLSSIVETVQEKPVKHKTTEAIDDDHRSFCLRIGTIAFGLGSMIFCGLECGTFFELPWNSPCNNILLAVNPLLQAVFVFMQMYLVFVNAKLNIHKFKIVARFGLMHLIATNLSVWIRTLSRLWLRDVMKHQRIWNATEDDMVLGNDLFNLTASASNRSCQRVLIMGNVFEEATPYLYPMVIKYSVICAAILYVMWRHVEPQLNRKAISSAAANLKRSKIDCLGSSRGLFAGLLLLVLSLTCLIAFFVFAQRKDFHLLATALAEGSHVILLLLSLLALPIGIFRVRRLRFIPPRRADCLNNILLGVSGFGILLYSCFCAVAASVFIMRTELSIPDLLLLVTHLLVILQIIVQALFIKDAARRRSSMAEHDENKPGRQVVSFLLMINVALWIVYTLEMQKVEADPIQIQFYGELPWILIVRFSLPLSILHRFHGAAMLAEIWRNTYRPHDV